MSMHGFDALVTISVVRHDGLDPATSLISLFTTVEALLLVEVT